MMSVGTLLCVVVVVVVSGHTDEVQVVSRPGGGYLITVGGKGWFNGGATWVETSSGTKSTATGTLISSQNATLHGTDPLGNYTGEEVTWKAGHDTFVTSYRQYGTTVVFRQTFPHGISGLSGAHHDDTLSGYPTFDTSFTTPKPVGYTRWAGDRFGGSGGGLWHKPSGHFGLVDSGPWALFTVDMDLLCVLSPARNFMAHSQMLVNNTVLSHGVMGSVTSIPAGFVLETILTCDLQRSGINSVVRQWGTALLKYYGKRPTEYLNDITLTQLGYSTDRGTYYYYHTEKNKTAEETLLDVKHYSDTIHVPYRYVLLDSWWYYKGEGGGVKNWSATPETFPHGIDYLVHQTGWAIQAHNRMWAKDNVYQTNYTFSSPSDSGAKFEVPLTQDFWDWLLGSKRHLWNLTVYEQDWMENEFMGVPKLLQDAEEGRLWLLQMSRAAEKFHQHIQYCMMWPRMVLQSVELPAVSQYRASGDLIDSPDQWKIGLSSMMGAALGLGPSKDSYTSYRQESKYYWYPRLQSAVLSLSGGPVTTGDQIGKTDVALVMRCCTADGLLLRPDEPATTIDALLLSRSGLVTHPDKGAEIWTTHTTIGGYRFTHVFSVTPHTYTMSAANLGYPSGTTLVAVESNTTTEVTPVTKGLILPPSNPYTFTLHHISPLLPSGWALLGELGKWVPTSTVRFTALKSTSSGAEVTFKGSKGEVVGVAFLPPKRMTPLIVQCTVGSTGVVTATVPDKKCA